MKKLIFFLLLPVLVYAQDRQTYSVNDFSGGLNVVTDSIDLQPNEAITLDNFVLDRFGALHKRYGVDTWNDSLISGSHIKDVEYVEDSNGDKNFYVATDSFIFALNSWDQDSVTTATWAGLEIDYTDGSIDSIEGRYVYGDSTSDSLAWIMVTAIGDYFRVGDSTYVIDSIFSDLKLFVSGISTPSEVADTIGDASYRLMKRVIGEPQLSSFNSKLFVADDASHPWYYDDDKVYLLGVADSGYVNSYETLCDTCSEYNGTDTILARGDRISIVGSGSFDKTTPSGHDVDAVGNMFMTTYRWFYYGEERNGYWQSRITSIIDTATIVLDRGIPFSGGDGIIINPADEGFSWGISHELYVPSSFATSRVSDSSKSWMGDEYIGFLLVNGNDATSASVLNLNENMFLYPDSGVDFTTTDRYYIISDLPNISNIRLHIVHLDPAGGYPNPWGDDPWIWAYQDTTYFPTNYYSQIIFHRNRLYAIGYSIGNADRPDSIGVRDTINTNRVWFSDIGLPNYMPSDWNFDLSGANNNRALFSSDQSTAMFILRDDLYVITNSNIYRISGEPIFGPEDLYVTQVIQGVGTNQSNGVITTKDNVAYIMNQQGIWLFDGNTIQKISYKIDPLVESYRNSNMVAGKFKDNLFFSYPDSGVTIVMHDPTKAFTTWNFGMEFINDQSVAIDSNYFLFSRFEDSAYIMKYPRNYSTFDDDWLPDSSIIYPAEYKSGWQTFGHYRDKVIEDLEITAYNPGVSALNNFFRLRINFADSIHWDSLAFANANRVHNFDNIGNSGSIWGKAYQFNVKDSTTKDFFLSNMRLKWYPATRRER